MLTVTQQIENVKPRQQSSSRDISREDRRLLLTSTLGLFLRRANHHIPVTAGDLFRLLPYVDLDADEQGYGA